MRCFCSVLGWPTLTGYSKHQRLIHEIRKYFLVEAVVIRNFIVVLLYLANLGHIPTSALLYHQRF